MGCKAQPQVRGQAADQRLAGFGAHLARLLELDDVPAHLPVGIDQLGVHSLHRPHPALGVGVGKLRQQLLVAGQVRQFHATPMRIRCCSTRLANVDTLLANCGKGVA
jgi:hypothetical protein